MPDSIAKYLLHLAQFPSAYDRHHRCKADAYDSMLEFGLGEHKASIVYHAVEADILREVRAELKYGEAYAEGDAYYLVTYKRIVHLPPDEPGTDRPEPPLPPDLPDVPPFTDSPKPERQ